MPSLFKTIGAVVCLVFAICFAAPTAHADSLTDGTINFTVTSGSPAPTGFFVFDNTTSTFTSFTVGWDGVIYNFGTSGITLAELGSSGFWCAAGPVSLSPGCPAEVVRLAILVLPEAPDDFSGPFPVANGTYTVTETAVATPEPSSLALMLSGVGLVFAMRKRSSGLQQAS
jgi:PEP-CTERM motif